MKLEVLVKNGNKSYPALIDTSVEVDYKDKYFQLNGDPFEKDEVVVEEKVVKEVKKRLVAGGVKVKDEDSK